MQFDLRLLSASAAILLLSACAIHSVPEAVAQEVAAQETVQEVAKAPGTVPVSHDTPVKATRADAPHWPAPHITQLNVKSPTHVLFVGNSYLYYNDSLHNHVKRMADAAGVFKRSPAVYKSATIGGAALRDHAIGHLIDPANLRVDASFEVVVMQGISSAGLTEKNRQSFVQAAASHAEKIKQAGGEPVLYMTPAYAKPHRRYHPDMMQDTASLYINTGNEIGAMVIPVGLAFEEAYRRRPDIALHNPFDHSHPDILGTYLAAATTAASLYGINPIGNDYDAFGKVSPVDALFLQTVAQDVVTRFYGRGETD